MKTQYLNSLVISATEICKFIASLFIFLIINSCSAQTPRTQGQFKGFSISTIDKTLENELRTGHVFSDSSPVPISRLRLLKIKHFGFDREVHNGEIIVLDACSIEVLYLFKDLYDQKFALERICLLNDYNGSDSLSMEDNNTSGHNLRPITGGKKHSLHSYGTAIDINPFMNPFVKIFVDTSICYPKGSYINLNRMIYRINKPVRLGMAEEVLNIFAKHGFYFWGGYWDNPIDYQHFEISREVSEILAAMSPIAASEFFAQVTNYYNEKKLPIENEIKKMKDDLGYAKKSISQLYRENNDIFNTILKKIILKAITMKIGISLRDPISA